MHETLAEILAKPSSTDRDEVDDSLDKGFLGVSNQQWLIHTHKESQNDTLPNNGFCKACSGSLCGKRRSSS